MSIENFYHEEAKRLAAMAEADETYQSRCIQGEKVFYLAADGPLLPGHIYSELGLDEYKISQACEYHFDKWFKEDD